MSGGEMRNGFVETALLDRHNLSIQGLKAITWSAGLVGEEATSGRQRKLLLSWDEKNIVLWEHNKLLRHLKLAATEGKGICSIAYISRMKMFIAASMNMQFIFYDNNLKTLDCIGHEERMVTDLEYDIDRDLVVISGSGGLSVWRATRRTLDRRVYCTIEKMFAFEDFSNWSNRILYEKSTGNLYALNENSLTVLSNTERKIIDVISESSEAPLTNCCWYEKSKFYITCNASGELNCWSSSAQVALRSINANNRSSGPRSNGRGSPVQRSSKCQLTHNMRPHTKAITGLAVHPKTDLVYTTSIDGYLKIINMEALSELFSLSMAQPVTHFVLMPGSFGADYQCVLGLKNGLIRVWTSAKCSDVVVSLDSRIVHFCIHTNHKYLRNSVETKSVQLNLSPDHAKRPEVNNEDPADYETAELEMEYNENDAYPDESLENENAEESRPNTGVVMSVELPPAPVMNEADEEERFLEQDSKINFTRNVTEPGYFLCQTKHYMKLWNSAGKLTTAVGTDSVVDGIRSYAISLKNDLLYCLMEDRSLRIFTLVADAIQASEGPVMVLPGSYFGIVDMPCSVCIANCIPRTNDNADGESNNVESSDERINEMKIHLLATGENTRKVEHDESLLIGGSIGTIRWLDTAAKLREIATTDVTSGSIESIKYNFLQKRLYAYASSIRDASAGSIYVYSLPTVTLIYAIEKLVHISCWQMSPAHSYVAVGTDDGYLRLFHMLEFFSESSIDISHASKTEPVSNLSNIRELDSSAAAFEEVVKLPLGAVHEVTLGEFVSVSGADTILPLSDGAHHKKKITNISFSESLPCLLTVSADCSVKFWSFDKILLQTVQFDSPIACGCFSSYHGVGDILISQEPAVLLVTGKTLELELLLHSATILKEDWLNKELKVGISAADINLFSVLSGVQHNVPSATSSAIAKPLATELPPLFSRESGTESKGYSRSYPYYQDIRPSSDASSRQSLFGPSKIRYVNNGIPFNVRKPARITASAMKSNRLIKTLPLPKPLAVDAADVMGDAVEPIKAIELEPRAPDASIKPSSSSGARKRVAFRA